jgi:hypothetical protein
VDQDAVIVSTCAVGWVVPGVARSARLAGLRPGEVGGSVEHCDSAARGEHQVADGQAVSDLALDLPAGPLYLRAVVASGPLDATYPQRLADAVLRAVQARS